jgi:hypothetical protein
MGHTGHFVNETLINMAGPSETHLCLLHAIGDDGDNSQANGARDIQYYRQKCRLDIVKMIFRNRL